jgi:hypothetical protein
MHLAKNANPRSEVTCKTCELHIMTLGKGTFRMIPGRQLQRDLGLVELPTGLRARKDNFYPFCWETGIGKDIG